MSYFEECGIGGVLLTYSNIYNMHVTDKKLYNYMEPVSVAEIVSTISNENALAVFKTISATRGDTELIRIKLNMTRKQYYSRIYKLLNAGLVKRKNKRYSLTGLGEVVYDYAMILEKALNSNNYWKLKAIDLFEIAPDKSNELSTGERNKIIHTLLKDDPKIRNIIQNPVSTYTI
jgi:predicted transcriptional regulator